MKSRLQDVYSHAHSLGFAEHRQRIFAAKPVVDTNPPKIYIRNFSHYTGFKVNMNNYLQSQNENMHLVGKINKIVCRPDNLSFRTNGAAGKLMSTVPNRIKKLEELDRENCTLAGWLKIPLHQDIKKEEEQNRKAKTPFKIPHEILSKYINLKIPKNPNLLKKFFRPQIRFDLAVNTLNSLNTLGSIYIQLFTEAAPQIVLELVRLCKLKQYQRLKFVRIFSSLWVESQVKLGEDTVIGSNIEFDKRVVDHGAHKGILSFSLGHMVKCKKGYLHFNISFKPLRELSGHTRVGFGRVVNGIKILDYIQEYGSKNGVPTKQVVICNCGLF